MYQSRLVPRVLPLLGFFGAALLVVAFTARLLNFGGEVSALWAIAALPIAVWEFSLGVWLIIKGFSPSLGRW